MIITLDDVKLQLNQTLDVDDALITRKIAAAQDHIEQILGFKIEATYGGDGQDPIPPALVEAVAQLAAHWYENREAVLIGLSAQHLPIGMMDILNSFRKWSWADG